ncbi:MAG: cytochrome c3 family protein [Phycisphaerales bacterium]
MIAWTLFLVLALAQDAPSQPASPPPTATARDSTGSTAPPPTTAIPREGCVTTECHPGVKSKPFLHGPVRVNGCDGCHKLTDAESHKFEPVRERHEMCALCHTPETPDAPYVHEPFARGECLACHDPHGSTEVRLLRGTRYADACYTCHKDMTAGHDRVHGPASIGACGACHQPHASRLPKLLNVAGRELCLKCHLRVAVDLETLPNVHAPALGDCSVCHDPHATDEKAVLVADPATLCTECHQDVAHTIHEATNQHAAVTTKRACLNCHRPHASANAALLREPVQTLCFECHNQPITLPDGTTLVNMKHVIESGKSLHGAISQRGCVECHEIHGGGHRRLLTNEYPSALYYPFDESAYALCFSCHDRQLVLEAKTTTATSFRNGDTNLHWVHVSKDKKGRSCKVCHDAHAASRDKHIRDEVPYGAAGWKLPIRYQPLPDGGRCGAGCHAPYEYNRVNPVPIRPAPDGAWKGEDLIPGSRADPARPPAGTPPANPGKDQQRLPSR